MSESDWQPIETGPKDGTKVLLFGPAFGVKFGQWYDRAEWWYGKLTNHDQYWYVEGRVLPLSIFAKDGSDDPTHWMSIPSPKLAESLE